MKSRANRNHPHLKPYMVNGFEMWRVSFALQGHQVRRQGFMSYSEAEDFYSQARSLIRAGQWNRLAVHKMAGWSLAEIYDFYCKTVGHKRSVSTIRNGFNSWTHHIKPLVGNLKPSEVSRRTLSAWVNQLRKNGLCDNSIKTAKAELSNILKVAVDYELISSVPKFPKLTARPKKKELLTPQEVRLVIDAADSPQLRVMILVQYQLALRVCELIGLEAGKFDLDAGTVLIDQQVIRSKKIGPWRQRVGPTKNRISRRLPLSPEVVEAIRPYVEDRNPTAPLWISRQLTPVSHNTYSEGLKRSVRKTGIEKNISTHCLRASMLDFLVNHSGLNIHAVAYFGRHSAKVLVSAYSQPDLELIFSVFNSQTPTALDSTCKLVAIEAEEAA